MIPGTPSEGSADLPGLVGEARAHGDALGFNRSCLDETGRLLALLCLGLPPQARVAELGTGVGVGAAYLASTLPPDGELWTAEMDPLLADTARALLQGSPGPRPPW